MRRLLCLFLVAAVWVCGVAPSANPPRSHAQNRVFSDVFVIDVRNFDAPIVATMFQDDSTLAVWTQDGHQHTLDTRTSELQTRRNSPPDMGFSGGLESMQPLDDNRVLVVRRTGRLSLQTDAAVLASLEFNHWISAALDAEQGRILVATTAGELVILPITETTFAEPQPLAQYSVAFSGVAWLSETHFLAWGRARRGVVTGWVLATDAQSATQQWTLPLAYDVGGVAFNPNQTRLAVYGDSTLALYTLPNNTDCFLTTAFDNVNLREGPSVNTRILGQLSSVDVRLVQAQTVDPADFIWWQLASGEWARADVVVTQGICATVRIVTMD